MILASYGHDSDNFKRPCLNNYIMGMGYKGEIKIRSVSMSFFLEPLSPGAWDVKIVSIARKLRGNELT